MGSITSIMIIHTNHLCIIVTLRIRPRHFDAPGQDCLLPKTKSESILISEFRSKKVEIIVKKNLYSNVRYRRRKINVISIINFRLLIFFVHNSCPSLLICFITKLSHQHSLKRGDFLKQSINWTKKKHNTEGHTSKLSLYRALRIECTSAEATSHWEGGEKRANDIDNSKRKQFLSDVNLVIVFTRERFCDGNRFEKGDHWRNDATHSKMADDLCLGFKNCPIDHDVCYWHLEE